MLDFFSFGAVFVPLLELSLRLCNTSKLCLPSKKNGFSFVFVFDFFKIWKSAFAFVGIVFAFVQY